MMRSIVTEPTTKTVAGPIFACFVLMLLNDASRQGSRMRLRCEEVMKSGRSEWMSNSFISLSALPHFCSSDLRMLNAQRVTNGSHRDEHAYNPVTPWMR